MVSKRTKNDTADDSREAARQRLERRRARSGAMETMREKRDRPGLLRATPARAQLLPMCELFISLVRWS